ncbi:hypothetical protein EDB89DRAFT_2076152 [Lactarius sanguifluus]|nr:hypothetical protein EDB89DRAFT_2076152 [Lactarius sanguifluus]
MARDGQIDNVTLNHPCGFSTDAEKAHPSNEIQVSACPVSKSASSLSILPANDLAIDPFRPVSAASPASRRRDDGVLAQTFVVRLASVVMRDVPSAASE